MSSIRQPNYLFDHNPPTEEDLIGRLFCNRGPELRFGMDRLRAPIAAGKICAVHGMPRSGKSHFVHRLLLEARQAGLPYLFLTVNANNRGTARAVLEEAYFKILERIRSVSPDQVPGGQTGILDEYLAYLSQYEDVVGRDSIEFTVERSTSVAHTQDVAAKGIALPFEINFLDRTEERAGTGNKLVQRSLSEHELVEILRYGMDVLAWLYPDKKVLLFVDDLDLLDRKGKEGQPESDLLVDHLKVLAEPPSLGEKPAAVVVLATVRQPTFTDRDKDFQDFVEVSLMDPEQHIAIYQRHIELFNAGTEVFTRQAVEWLEEGSGGQVGMFLRRCHQLWQRFYGRLPEGVLIDVEQIRQFVKQQVRQMVRDPDSLTAVEAVIGAVRAGARELTLEADPGRAGLIFTVLSPIAAQGKYSINPIYFEVIREMIQQGLV